MGGEQTTKWIYYMSSSASGQDEPNCGYPSGQDGAMQPVRDNPFCSRNNISPKYKRLHESFLSQNIYRDSKKIFCDFSTGM